MYSFKLYNTNKCINYVNKSFQSCYKFDSSNNITYLAKYRNINKSVLDRKKCLKNDIPSCCRITPIPEYLPIGNPPFIIQFDYIGVDVLNVEDFILNYLPINNSDGGFTKLAYNIVPLQPLPNNTVTLYIYWKYQDNPIGNLQSGVTFTTVGVSKPPDFTVVNWWNANTNNINILQWGGIPLSRAALPISFFQPNDFAAESFGQQFKNLVKLTKMDATDAPTILINSSLNNIFENCSNFNANLNSWNTSNITIMYASFKNATSFNNGDIGNNGLNPFLWNTSNVLYMTSMFEGASSFNQNISNWNTVNLIYMNSIFKNAILFNNGEPTNNRSNPLTWNIIGFVLIDSIFEGASSFNQSVSYDPINNYWNITNPDTSMFLNATIFNNGDIAGGTSKPMNWPVIDPFSPPFNFSVGSALTLGPPPAGNSPYNSTG